MISHGDGGKFLAGIAGVSRTRGIFIDTTRYTMPQAAAGTAAGTAGSAATNKQSNN